MGFLGKVGTGFAAIGGFIPGIGTAIAAAGSFAAQLDPEDPEALAVNPYFKWDPYAERGFLWGLPSIWDAIPPGLIVPAWEDGPSGSLFQINHPTGSRRTWPKSGSSGVSLTKAGAVANVLREWRDRVDEWGLRDPVFNYIPIRSTHPFSERTAREFLGTLGNFERHGGMFPHQWFDYAVERPLGLGASVPNQWRGLFGRTFADARKRWPKIIRGNFQTRDPKNLKGPHGKALEIYNAELDANLPAYEAERGAWLQFKDDQALEFERREAETAALESFNAAWQAVASGELTIAEAAQIEIDLGDLQQLQAQPEELVETPGGPQPAPAGRIPILPLAAGAAVVLLLVTRG